jgi:hypothetical protein
LDADHPENGVLIPRQNTYRRQSGAILGQNLFATSRFATIEESEQGKKIRIVIVVRLVVQAQATIRRSPLLIFGYWMLAR